MINLLPTIKTAATQFYSEELLVAISTFLRYYQSLSLWFSETDSALPRIGANVSRRITQAQSKREPFLKRTNNHRTNVSLDILYSSQEARVQQNVNDGQQPGVGNGLKAFAFARFSVAISCDPTLFFVNTKNGTVSQQNH